jgi:hypothetical protein
MNSFRFHHSCLLALFTFMVSFSPWPARAQGISASPPPTASCSVSPTEIWSGDPVTAAIVTLNFNPKHTVKFEFSSTGGRVLGLGTGKIALTLPNDGTPFALKIRSVDTADLAPGQYTVTATAIDEKEKKNKVVSCNATFAVKQPLPPLVSCSANPTTIAVGQPSTITMTAADPQGWPMTYSWSATGGQFNGSGTSATVTATNADAGNTITVTGIAKDARANLSGSCNAQVNVQAP